MGLTARETFMLFPTGFFRGRVPDITLCDRIEKNLRAMQKAGEGFTAKSYLRSFMTADNLQTRPEMKELVDLIMEESKLILDVYRMKRDSHYIVNMWANITSPNRRQNTHVHANCVFSGLVYIKTPKNCGSTMFFSPQHLSTAISPDFSEKTELNTQIFSFPAEKGLMLFWPSYLPHSVDNGNASEDEDRIVVAFNIMIRGRINAPTISLTLA